jgi:hypothetical protein
MRRPTFARLVAVVMLALLLLFGAYMTAFYVARPNEPNECLAWEWDIFNARMRDGKMPFFYPAYVIDEKLRDILGLGPRWQPRYPQWPWDDA